MTIERDAIDFPLGGEIQPVTERVEQLASAFGWSEAEVLVRALQAGVDALWREYVVGEYLQGRISRDEAIEKTSYLWVRQAERERAAVLEDIEQAKQVAQRL